ncbi:MAG TPA: hypothetical protein VGW39_07595 [Chthoniobacterales bacterium]|nr:hypothetical protein [Chthoniobacterales bacterium]
MHQIKIFQGLAEDLTGQINDWLRTNKVPKIRFTTQSQGEGSLITISIWY